MYDKFKICRTAAHLYSFAGATQSGEWTTLENWAQMPQLARINQTAAASAAQEFLFGGSESLAQRELLEKWRMASFLTRGAFRRFCRARLAFFADAENGEMIQIGLKAEIAL